MIARPDVDTLHALVRMRAKCPQDFETFLKYLTLVETKLLIDTRDCNDDKLTRLHQGAARAIDELADKISSAHQSLTARADANRESTMLPVFSK